MSARSAESISSTQADHNKILAASARRALTPLGFQRKGRSRMWLADRGFWLAVVEFQPSSFSKGSYLNVAAHWLWGARDVLTFDHLSERQKPWIPFENVEQFAPLVEQLARQAVAESEQLKNRFSNFRAVAALLIEEEAASAMAHRGGGWPAFNAAVAAGAIGEMTAARSFFETAWHTLGQLSPDLQALLGPYRDALQSKIKFPKFVAQQIDKQRLARRFGSVDLTEYFGLHRLG